MNRFWSVALGWSLILGIAVEAPAQSKPLVELVPETAIFYLEITQPEAVWAQVQKLRRLEQTPLFRLLAPLRNHPSVRQPRKLLQALGNQVQMDPWELLHRASNAQVAVAVEPIHRSVLVFLQGRQPEASEKLLQALVGVAKQLGRESRRSSLQGLEVHDLGGELFAVRLGALLVLSNSSSALRQVLDRHLGRVKTHLGTTQDYRKARQLADQFHTGWAMFRLAPVKFLPQFHRVVSGKHDEPVLELLAGGILDALAQAEVVAAGIDLQTGELRVGVILPWQPDRVAARRQWFFAPQEESGGGLLRPPGTVASLTFYRDLAQWWKLREELFESEVLGQFDEAEATLGLFLGRVELQEDVLAHLDPRVRVVVARQDFSPNKAPALKLPAAALVIKMKHPEAVRQSLLVAYQRVVSFLNIIGVQQDFPPLILETQQHRGHKLFVARFVLPPQATSPKETLYYNFAPSAIEVGRYFVISSTPELAKAVVDELLDRSDPPAQGLNTALWINWTELAAVLKQNQAALTAQTLLTQGVPPEKAQQTMNQLLQWLRQLREATVALRQESDRLVLELKLHLP